MRFKRDRRMFSRRDTAPLEMMHDELSNVTRMYWCVDARPVSVELRTAADICTTKNPIP